MCTSGFTEKVSAVQRAPVQGQAVRYTTPATRPERTSPLITQSAHTRRHFIVHWLRHAISFKVQPGSRHIDVMQSILRCPLCEVQRTSIDQAWPLRTQTLQARYVPEPRVRPAAHRCMALKQELRHQARSLTKRRQYEEHTCAMLEASEDYNNCSDEGALPKC